MSLDVALGDSDGLVRSVSLRRDVARVVPGSSLHYVLSPVAPPRLWGTVSECVSGAIERAAAERTPSAEALQAVIAAAATAVERLRGRLVEPHLVLDAQVGIVWYEPTTLHVALTAGTRLYRARGGVPDRLFADRARSKGIGAGGLVPVSERVQPGDLLILGTDDAFSVRSIGNLAGAFSKGVSPAVVAICDAVIGPCRDAHMGAAALVLRAA